MLAIDNKTISGKSDGSESSVTWEHTCNGDDRVLVVYVYSWGNKTTGVTYNGTAMTLVDKQTWSVQNRTVSCYIMINPPSGAHNVVASLSSNDYVRTAAISFTGAKQSSQPQTKNVTRMGKVATVTKTVTTTGRCLLLWGFDTNSSGSAGTGTTLYYNSNLGIAYGNSVVSAGDNSLQLTSVATNYDFVSILIAIEEKATEVKTGNFLNLF